MSIPEDIIETFGVKEPLYLSWDDTMADFTVKKTSMVVHSRSKEYVVEIADDRVVSHVYESIFCKDRVVIGWNIKQLFSYLRFLWSGKYENVAKVIDLKSAEAFCGKRDVVPGSWEEAIARVKEVAGPSAVLRKRLYEPLAMEVLPGIETVGLVDVESKRRRYCSYEIEGQVNGRLLSGQINENYFNPHVMDEKEKSRLVCGNDEKFVVLDYKHMEVSVLHWLSKDKFLGQLLDSGRDFYQEVFRVISGRNCCRPQDREFAKAVFLPIHFSLQAETLAKNHGIGVRGAQMVIDAIAKNFSESMAWIEGFVEKVKGNPVVVDHFGRSRNFADKPWGVRNAVVQSPAAIICLDKLVSLFRELKYGKIVASVHDGYILVVPKKEVSQCVVEARGIMLRASDFYPDLVLRLDVKVGDKLNLLESVPLE